MHVAIVGNGISGITAARTLRKLNSECRITVISAETKYFYSRTALMYIYMGHMTYEHTKPYEDYFWEKNRIDLIQDYVKQIDFKKNQLNLEKSNPLNYDKLLIATGSKSNKFGWPGQHLKGVQGLYSYQDLELLEKNTHPAFTPASKQRVRHAVIVGGGLIGIELAEMLHTRNIEVTFLVRERRFWGNVLPKEEGELVGSHMNSHGVNLFVNTELKEILSDEEGRVKSVITNDRKEIDCQFVGLTAGVSPNVDFLKDTELAINRGILVNSKLKTNIPNVYAAGDCTEFDQAIEGRKAIEQVWYTGRMMGEVAGNNLNGDNKEYSPGPWFNSAKFFDIEYQTYGVVNADSLQGESSFYWQNESGDKCLRLAFRQSDESLLGLNVFGIRLRHEKMHHFLSKGIKVDEFLRQWNDVCFDPEFQKSDIESIVNQYNVQFNKDIRPLKKSWKRIFAQMTV